MIFSFNDVVSVERHGVGRHQWNVPLSEIPTILRVSDQAVLLSNKALTDL